MNALAGYGSDSSECGSSDEERVAESPSKVISAKKAKNELKLKLPSANDVFKNVETPVFLAQPARSESLTIKPTNKGALPDVDPAKDPGKGKEQEETILEQERIFRASTLLAEQKKNTTGKQRKVSLKRKCAAGGGGWRADGGTERHLTGTVSYD